MSFLSISLLGSFQVTLDGQTIDEFEYSKVKGLLAYLAVESDRPHHRELLAETLWPDRPAQMARNSLRQALSILRNAINDREAEVPFLLVSRDSVQFNRRSDYWLDIDVFMDSLNSCRDSLRRQSDPTGSACLHWFRQAARLYRGDFLDQFLINDSDQFSHWMNLKRDEFRRLAAEVFWVIASYYEKKGDFEEVRKYAERQVDLDPTNEEAHRRLMRIYYQQGERSNAIAQYELCSKSLSEYLGVLPEDETRQLYERIKSSSEERSDASGSAAGLISRPHNLPRELTPLIGRQSEINDLTTILKQEDVRLLSIVGQGGIGKSRLAIKAATELLETFEDGVFFLSLASLNDVETIPYAIADALGLSFFGQGDRSKHLIGYLRERSMLLIFDNFEHIIEGKTLIAEILQYARSVKAMVTSREPLRIPGENIFELHGLGFPSGKDLEDLESFSAIQLFVRSARRSIPDFSLTPENRKSVARICELVDGLPLGIELAASWLRILGPEEIVKEIEASTHFLESTDAQHPERHRSLRVVFQNSWNLLSEKEQSIFASLSIFRGGFTREAGEQITGIDLVVLSSLMNRSLISRVGSLYVVHEVLRQFAYEKMTELSGLKDKIEKKYIEYYADFLRSSAGRLRSSVQAQSLAELEEQDGNIRNAWKKAVEKHQIHALESMEDGLGLYFDIRGWFSEGQELFGEAVFSLLSDKYEARENTRGLIAALRAREGWFYLRRGKFSEAQSLFEKALEAQHQLKYSERELAVTYLYMGIHAYLSGENAIARSYLEKSLSGFIKNENNWGMAEALRNLGFTTVRLGFVEDAKIILQESIEIYGMIGDRRGISLTLDGLGKIALMQGDLEEANRSFMESLEIQEAVSDRWSSAGSLWELGNIALKKRNNEVARSYFEKSLLIYRETGDEWGVIHLLNCLGEVDLASGNLTKARNNFIMALGRSWEAGILPGILDSFLGLAQYYEMDGDTKKSEELLRLVWSHPVSREDQKQKARDSLEYMDLEPGEESHANDAQDGKEEQMANAVKQMVESLLPPGSGD